MAWAFFTSVLLASLSLFNIQRVIAEDVIVQHNDQRVGYGSGALTGWSRQFGGLCANVGYSYSQGQPSWATLDFEGTAIQAFLLKASNAGTVYVTVDGFMQTPNRGVDLYTPSVSPSQCSWWTFEKTGLAWGNHSITVTNIGNSDDYIFLHKFVYTVPDSPPPPSNPGGNSNAALVGGLVGGIAGVIVPGVLLWLAIRRRRQRIQPATVASTEGSSNLKAEATDVQSSTTRQSWQPDPSQIAAYGPGHPINPYQSIATMNYSPHPSSFQLPGGRGSVPSSVFTPQEMEIIQTLGRRPDIPGATIEAFMSRMLAERGPPPTTFTNNTGPGRTTPGQ